MTRQIDMNTEDPRGLLLMIIFMGLGQLLMLLPVPFADIQSPVLLFSILDLDKYLMMMVHLLSAISFCITIMVGIPKAYKVIQSMKFFQKRRIRKRRKL